MSAQHGGGRRARDDAGPRVQMVGADAALGLIGRTPLVKLARVSPEGGATIWAKAEFLNPGGSVKDRPALSMIRAAEREQRLAPGATIVEETTGNTGISLQQVAA